ncbi:hypothetical protein BOW65_21415 [Pseudomonas koreensis]|uniref:GIY-YIG nuclease family protein n=1 Tax=Pseudomonas koreensis TaxID=198620 RepID=UPI000984E313|nr:GIY-YIG nuclease family protein [Pseudomonas koreensis]OOH77578.1 hypothetical protein BOW65_21415 [Pseudomonas koreensis]
MAPGYLYILQNPLYDAYAIKIGLTTRMPDVRAKELYIGSSGVPAPFEIATAYSVGDCKLAEKRTHKRLAAYRLNGRREFFRISPSVAAFVAYDTCAKINNELGVSPPELFELKKTQLTAPGYHANNKAEKIVANSKKIEKLAIADLDKLISSPPGTSILTPEQLDRVEILKLQLSQIFPEKIHEILSGFNRDQTPEREIRIWETITKAYLTIEQIDFASDELKMEAFHLLLMRSGSPTDEVLRSFKLQYFSLKSAKRLLQAYEMRPKPIIVKYKSHLAVR